MEETKETVQMKEIKDTLKEHGKILEQQGEKIDKILSAVLTQQGEMKILQNQMKTIQTDYREFKQEVNERFDKQDKRFDKIEADHEEFKQEVNERFDKQDKRFDKIEADHKEFKQEVNKRFDKQEADHEELKTNIGILLNYELKKRDKAISKQAKDIKKLQNKPKLPSWIKTGIKKLVSKPN